MAISGHFYASGGSSPLHHKRLFIERERGVGRLRKWNYSVDGENWVWSPRIWWSFGKFRIIAI